MTAEAMICEMVWVAGHDGDPVPAYLARPLGDGPHHAVVVVHYALGWDSQMKETTRAFAARGYVAICPNLHDRELPGGDPAVQAEIVRTEGRVPDARFLGDMAGTFAHLRTLPATSGRVAVVGYCSGGRQSLLTGCSFPVDAVVDCYGGRVALDEADLYPRQPEAVLGMLDRLSAPVLGLFGGADTEPAPAQTAIIAAELERLGKPHEFHTYDGVGHGFFSVDRENYDVDAATDGWARIWSFLATQLDERQSR